MVTTPRIDRISRGVRRWRERRSERVEVAPNLSHRDIETVAAAIDDSISQRGGEVAARRRARALADAYRELDADGRLRFFELLADRYGYDDSAIESRLHAVVELAASRSDERASAYRALNAALQPRYRPLLQRLAGMGGGFALTIKLREDLLEFRRRSPGLTMLDTELRELLSSWFDVSLLQLERLTWNSPAATLELLIKYEAVHAIDSWSDLRQRLGTGRRCYAFMHPAMPGDPLIFVEVALTKGLADSVVPFIHQRDTDHPNGNIDNPDDDIAVAVNPTEADANTAIFYSISNCHRGLTGVSLGDFLIKSVVESIRAELPHIERFATLSPMPGLRQWLIGQLDAVVRSDAVADSEVPPLLRLDERHSIAAAAGVADEEATAVFDALVRGSFPGRNDPVLTAARPALMRLAARYIVLERRPGSTTALDPVANFHLSNGARAERLNWQANPSTAGWDRGLGMMINYRYRIQSIERNHDLYVNAGEVVAAPAVTETLDDRPS